MQEAQEVECPHCGAPTVFFVDPSEGTRQELIEDCQVCCRAILFRVVLTGGETRIQAESTE
jgi:ribosomal protein S27E